MTASTLATVQELAARFADDERNLTLYFPDLETAPAPASLNRVFGPPVGLTDEQWPRFPELAELLQQTNSMKHWDPRDHRMEHVFTVDLRGVELLGVPDDAVAMMLFISNASFHRASCDGNPHTTVRFLREHDLRQGLYRGSLPQRSLYRWSRRFSLVPIAVPGDVFDVPELELAADDPLVALHDAIGRAPARLGGCPIAVGQPAPAPEPWAESTPTLPHVTESSRTVPFVGQDRLLEDSRTLVYDDGDPASALTFASGGSPVASRHPAAIAPHTPFLMQFQRGFAEVNLGQRGVMYVSGRSAYVPSL